jgi:hypothetical protein
MVGEVDFAKFVAHLISSNGKKNPMQHATRFLLAIMATAVSCARQSTGVDAGASPVPLASSADCALACGKRVKSRCDHDYPLPLTPFVMMGPEGYLSNASEGRTQPRRLPPKYVDWKGRRMKSKPLSRIEIATARAQGTSV